MNKKQDIHFVGLLHNIDWQIAVDTVHLDKNLSIQKYEGSKVEVLVNKLSTSHNFDDGEPLSYGAFIECISEKKDDEGAWWNSALFIDRVVSLIGIVNGGGVPVMLHLLGFINYKNRRCGYIESLPSEMRHGNLTFLYEAAHQKNVEYKITDSNVLSLKKAFNNLRVQDYHFDRLRNAVDYYSKAWRTYYLEDSVVLLAVALECLFAPHSSAELSFQVSSNISKFLFNDLKKRLWCKKIIKELYNERSKIVHGGAPSGHQYQWDTVWNAYQLTSKTLKKILCNSEMINLFRNDKQRREFLDVLLLK